MNRDPSSINMLSGKARTQGMGWMPCKSAMIYLLLLSTCACGVAYGHETVLQSRRRERSLLQQGQSILPNEQNSGSDGPIAPPPPPPAPPAIVVPPANITTVSTAEELQQAVDNDVRDIEIVAHLDLRGLAITDNPFYLRHPTEKNERATHTMYVRANTRSIRGNCGADVDKTVLETMENATFGRVEYPPLKPYQCVLLMDKPFLWDNNSTMWIDHLYLAVARTRVDPDFAMIQYGNFFFLEGVPGRSLYITGSTFVGEGRGDARAIATYKDDVSVLIEGSVFSSFTGDAAPLAFVTTSHAAIRHSTFRDMALEEEIFDVSSGSSVLLENCTFTNITVPDNEYVSTSFSDFQSFAEAWTITYYPEDDDGPDFDINRWRVNDSDGAYAGADTWVESETMSDCMFRWDTNLPGCPEPLSTQLKNSYNRRAAEGQGLDPDTVVGDGQEAIQVAEYEAGLPEGSMGASGGAVSEPGGAPPGEDYDYDDYPDYQSVVPDSAFLMSDDLWLQETRAVLPTRDPAPADFNAVFSPFAPDPPRNLPPLVTAGTAVPPQVALAVQELGQTASDDAVDIEGDESDDESSSDSSSSGRSVLVATICAAAALLLCAAAVFLGLRNQRLHQKRQLPALAMSEGSETDHLAPAHAFRVLPSSALSDASLRHHSLALNPTDNLYSTPGALSHIAAESTFQQGTMLASLDEDTLGENVPEGAIAAHERGSPSSHPGQRTGVVDSIEHNEAEPGAPTVATMPTQEEAGEHAPEWHQAGEAASSHTPPTADPAQHTSNPNPNLNLTSNSNSNIDYSILASSRARMGAAQPPLQPHLQIQSATEVSRTATGVMHVEDHNPPSPPSPPSPIYEVNGPRSYYVHATNTSIGDCGRTTGSIGDSDILPVPQMVSRAIQPSQDDVIVPNNEVSGCGHVHPELEGVKSPCMRRPDDKTLIEGVNTTQGTYNGVRVMRIESMVATGTMLSEGSSTVATGVTPSEVTATEPNSGGEARAASPEPSTYPAQQSPDVSIATTDVVFGSGSVTNLTKQLNSFQKKDLFLGRFRMLDRSERRRGGQAVVQFAKGVVDNRSYAIKFFLDSGSFYAEAALYAAVFPHLKHGLSADALCGIAKLASADTPEATSERGLGVYREEEARAMQAAGSRFLPQVEALRDTSYAALVDPSGAALPPCIVMERGESLEEWALRAEPDLFAAVALLANVSERLAHMHEAGFVHRDLKPGNVMWLPRANRWTVIDFGCAARVGTAATLSFTLAYAAPEVIRAVELGEASIACSPALDAWSLGVMAFELLTHAPAFRLVTDGRAKVMAQLRGEIPLPWEGEMALDVERRLGELKNPIQQLLQRDPARRVTLKQFYAACRHLFSSSTAHEA